MNNILISTYSIDNDLVKKCHALIGKRFKTKILNNWDQSDCVLNLLELDADWVIHIDEDAFIINDEAIVNIITYMEANNFVCCGMPDGGVVSHRLHNPIACNPYFLILDVKKLRALREVDPEIKSCTWEKRFEVDTDEMVKKSGIKYSYDNFEPYYYFFFWLKKNNNKILYLKGRDWPLENERVTTELFDINNKSFCLHTWYSREYRKFSFNKSSLAKKIYSKIKTLFGFNRGAHYDRINSVIKYSRLWTNKANKNQ